MSEKFTKHTLVSIDGKHPVSFGSFSEKSRNPKFDRPVMKIEVSPNGSNGYEVSMEQVIGLRNHLSKVLEDYKNSF